ncbi:MAG: tetratricopeptide repeat protein [Anaerolineae bacterium]|nr:tetratricopeptide repeat protein [Anaerolineae bacterium]
MPYTPMELANAFIRTGELTDALAALDARLAEAPDDDEARRLRAAVLLRLPVPDALARAAADLAALPQPTAADYVQLALLAERRHDLPGAIAAMQAACRLEPADERLLERLPGLYVQQGNIPAALDVVRAQPRTWRWLQWQADLEVQQGAFAAAADLYEQAQQHLEARFAGQLALNRVAGAIRARLLLARAFACRRCGRLGTAEQLYHEAQRYYPDDPTVLFNLGLLRALHGDLAGALAQCRQALDTTDQALLRAEMVATLRQEAELQPLAAQLLPESLT